MTSRRCRAATLPSRYLNTGFTLLELLVVLVLAASMVAAVSVSGQAFLSRSRYHEAVRDVTALLNDSRTRAKASGIPVKVWWNQSGRILQTSEGRVVRFHDGVEVSLSNLPSSQSYSQGLLAFVFSEDGASGGTLHIRRGEGAGVQIRVNWVLGSVDISEMAVNP